MSTLKFKQFLTAVVFGFLAIAVQAKEISILVYSPEGGNNYQQSQMLADSLTKTGYRVNLVKANNCIGTKNFLDNNPSTPAIVFYSDIVHIEHRATGCDLAPNKDNFVTMTYMRINAMCSSAAVHTNRDSVLALLNSAKPITIASSVSTPPAVIEAIGQALGKKVSMVPYSGTGGSLRGVLGRDADFWYGGLTASIVENKELFCWANTGQTTIHQMVPLKDLMPKYNYAEFSSYWFIQGGGMNADVKKNLKQDLDKIFADPEWSQYISKSYMVPSRQLKNAGADEVIKNVNSMK